MIPANIDYVAIVRELATFGYGNRKLDLICGFAEGSIAYIVAGDNRDMTYQRAARLYNLWWEERQMRGLEALTPMVALFSAEKTPAVYATT